MPDGKVTVTLSVQDAEALRAWQRAKQGIGEMEREFGRAKRGAKGVSDEIKKLTQFAQTQSPWAKGVRELEAQRTILQQEKTEIRAAARAADAHWQKQIAIAEAAKQAAEATGKMGDELQEAGAPGAGLSGLVKSFGAAITGAFSLQKALGMVKAEYEALIARGKAAAGFQVSLGGAQRAMLRNLSGQELTVKEVDLAARTISAATGADLTAVYQAVGSALSARGSLSEKEAVESVAKTFELDPSFVADEGALLAGASLDMRKAFGGTPEQALGAMLTSQQTARIVTTQDFAANAAPALLGLHAFGDSFREASTLFATISQQSADVSGRRSGSAAIRFAQQLREATPFIEGASTEQRRQWLVSGDPEAEKIRRRLLGTMRQEYEKSETQEAAEADPTRKAELHAEAKQFLAMIELLERGSDTYKAFEQTYTATPEYEMAGARYQQNLSSQRQLGLQKTVRQAEIGRAALQTALQEESRGAVSQIRSDVTALLEQAGSFGKSGGDYVVSETGFFSDLNAIESGMEVRHRGRYESEEQWQKRAERLKLPREVRAADAAIRILEARLQNARQSGQYEDPEFAKTREALEKYIAAQKTERERLLQDSSQAAQPPAPTSSRLVDYEKMNRFSQQAKAAAAAAEKPAQEKEAKKQQAALDKKLAKEVRDEQAKQARLKKQADTTGKQAAKLEQDAEEDAARVAELQKQLDVRRRIYADSTSRPTARSPWDNGGKSRGPKKKAAGKSDATRLREAESIRRLEKQLDDTRRELAETREAAQRKQDEHTALLRQLVANTANPQVTVKNPGDPQRKARAASPPKPPIGNTTP